MDEILLTLQNIQKELADQKTEIRKSADQVTENITKMFAEKLKSLEEKSENLEKRVENQEQRLYYMEKLVRQKNIVFFGIEEKEKSYFELESTILNFVKSKLKIELGLKDIESVSRKGKKSDKPRPIVVTFSTVHKKIEILKTKKSLNDTTYYVKEDFPTNILIKRKELQEQAKLEREKGNKAIIRYDKLIIIEKTGDESRSNPNKRNLSVSPTNDSTLQSPNLQAVKRNKASSVNSTSDTKTNEQKQRTSSLSEGIVKPSMLNFLIPKNAESPHA